MPKFLVSTLRFSFSKPAKYPKKTIIDTQLRSKAWAADEKRESKMVFIGRNLPKRIFVEGLAYCVADSENAVIEVK